MTRNSPSQLIRVSLESSDLSPSLIFAILIPLVPYSNIWFKLEHRQFIQSNATDMSCTRLRRTIESDTWCVLWPLTSVECAILKTKPTLPWKKSTDATRFSVLINKDVPPSFRCAEIRVNPLSPNRLNTPSVLYSIVKKSPMCKSGRSRLSDILLCESAARQRIWNSNLLVIKWSNIFADSTDAWFGIKYKTEHSRKKR